MSEEKRYFKLAPQATNFTDLGQSIEENKALCGDQVKNLDVTRKVRKGLKHGAIEEVKEAEYKEFLKRDEQEKKNAQKAQKNKRDNQVKNDSAKEVAKANEAKANAESALAEEKEKTAALEQENKELKAKAASK